MIWEPSRQFIERTNVWRFMQRLGFSDREAFLHFSRENPERFWDEIMREMGVEWFEPYHQVLDASRGPEWSQWFIGGRLNIAHNCLDRWADSGRIACIWEGENGATARSRSPRLRNDANRVANGLPPWGCSRAIASRLHADGARDPVDSLRLFQGRPDRGADLRGLRRRRHRHPP